MLYNRGEEKNKIIFVDIDDTLADTRAAVAALYKRNTGENPLDTKSVKSKMYAGFCPLWTDVQVDNLFRSSKELYEILEPLEGAVEGINYLLKKGYDVRIVTMHYPFSIQYKYEWIKKYFPMLEDKAYYVDTRMKNKDVFKGLAIIDDDMKNIATNESDMPILLDFYGIYDEVEHDSIVCRNWGEVIKKILREC